MIDYNIYTQLPRYTPLCPAPRLLSLSNHELPIKGACTVRLAGTPANVIVCHSV